MWNKQTLQTKFSPDNWSGVWINFTRLTLHFTRKVWWSGDFWNLWSCLIFIGAIIFNLVTLTLIFYYCYLHNVHIVAFSELCCLSDNSRYLIQYILSCTFDKDRNMSFLAEFIVRIYRASLLEWFPSLIILTERLLYICHYIYYTMIYM